MRKFGAVGVLALGIALALWGCGDNREDGEEAYQPYDTTFINSVLPSRAFCDAQGYRQENDYSEFQYFTLDSCQNRLWADFVVDSKWERGYEPGEIRFGGFSAYFVDLDHVIELSPKIKDLYWVIRLGITDSDSLRSIPAEVFEPDSLRRLWLEGLPNLDSLPQALHPTATLDTLFIRDIKPNAIPNSYWDISWRELSLLNIGLKEVPPQIANQSRLSSLGLNRNEITQIPAFIGELDSLVLLNVLGNQITELPINWCEFRINNIDLGFNKLCTVADSAWTCVQGRVRNDHQECGE